MLMHTFTPPPLMCVVDAHTWGSFRPGASSHIDDGLIWSLGVVGPKCWDADALGHLDFAVALFDDLNLLGSLKEKHALYAHPSWLTHLVQSA